MNSFTNSLLIFFTIPLLCLTVYIGLDVPIDFLHTTGSELPYQGYMFLGFALLFFIILIWRNSQMDGLVNCQQTIKIPME